MNNFTFSVHQTGFQFVKHVRQGPSRHFFLLQIFEFTTKKVLFLEFYAGEVTFKKEVLFSKVDTQQGGFMFNS